MDGLGPRLAPNTRDTHIYSSVTAIISSPRGGNLNPSSCGRVFGHEGTGRDMKLDKRFAAKRLVTMMEEPYVQCDDLGTVIMIAAGLGIFAQIP